MAAEQAVSILLTRLAPLVVETVGTEVNLLSYAPEEAQCLSSKLEEIQKVLEDAELKAAKERREAAFQSGMMVTMDRKVQNWLRKLQHITYEIEDVLDKWEVENIKRQLEEESRDVASSSSKEKKLFLFLKSACLCFKQTIDRRSVAWEIKEINKKLDLIAKEKDNEFDCVPNVGHVCKDSKSNTSTTSFVDVSEVHGREAITMLLAGQEHTHEQVHQLERLQDANCWSIISKIAFNGRAEGDCKMLEETGQKIAKKCKGLPFAAKIIGGVLHSKTSLQEWQHVLESEMHELKYVRENIFSLLTLSYNELHPTVRRCFSYCAIFLKDTVIEVDMLIRFWMAQGFLSSTENADDMELTGREYFKDLAMRSFFQDFEKDDMTGRIARCKMHDMVHDYAQFLTNNECLVLDPDHQGGKKASNIDARHLNLIMRDAGGLDCVHNYERLRSFICYNGIIAPNLFAHLKKVRLVSVNGCELKNIPEEIGNLIHLRYLDIGRNKSITKLPETICDLYNLQTLCISGCWRLCELPQEIHKLINLRHLLNSLTDNCRLPKGLEKLINLRTLAALHATSKSGDSGLGLLKNLNHLAGRLAIFISGEGWNVEEAKKADLKSKELIKGLKLECEDGMNMEVVEALQPHPNLIRLQYVGGGGHLPKWITTLTHLKSLFILKVRMPSSRNLSIEDLFYHVGKFPSLETLSMQQVEIKHVGSNFLSRTFPKLRKLTFSQCENWEEWEDMKGDKDGGNEDAGSTNTAQLEEVYIGLCYKLKALPIHFLRVKRLQHLKITTNSRLRDRYKSEEGLTELEYSGCRVEWG